MLIRYALIALLGISGALAAQMPDLMYYRFNEGTGSSTANSAVPGVGSNPLTIPATTTTPWVTPGRLGAAAIDCQTLTASGIRTNYSAGLSVSSSWTIEFWTRLYNISVGHAFRFQTNSFRLSRQATGTVQLLSTGGTPNTAIVLPNPPLNQWVHYAFVYDHTIPAILIYIDGVLDSTNPRTAAAEGELAVGSFYTTQSLTNPWRGDMDEFRIWGVARTAAEIAASMNTELFPGPQVAVSATPGTALPVFSTATGPGGTGIQAGKFTLTSNNLGTEPWPNSFNVTEIALAAQGSGDDSAAFSEVAIYRDADSSGTYTAGDILVATANGFPANDGTINFAVTAAEQSFPASTARDYFIVVKLNGTALPTQTFQFRVQDVTVASSHPTPGRTGVPSAVMNGLVIETPEFVFADASPAAAAPAYLNSTGNVVQAFTVAYANGPNDLPGAVTFNGLGTAHEVDDLAAVQLWFDANDNGSFESGVDTLLDTGNYAADNGSVSLAFTGHATFAAGNTRRYFLTYSLNANATHQTTFQSYLASVAVSALGAANVGLPAPGLSGTPGLEVNANLFIATLNGPASPVTVDSNGQGPTADGELICDMTLGASSAGGWVVTGLTFAASGTGNSVTAYSEVALYEDNGNGAWDGAAVDTLAAPTLAAFSAGGATFSLTNSSFGAGLDRRFFLVGKLAGTAIAGQTFGARLESVATTPPAGGVLSGIPSADSSALVIGASVLTVLAGSGQPSPVTHRAGTAADYLVAHILLTASNEPATVSALNFTATGSGDWQNDVSEVRVYLDDGDSQFDAGLDAVVFQGPGASAINAVLSPAMNIPNAGSRQLWVVVALTDTAGIGASSAPVTFSLSLIDATAVSATRPVTLGTPAPASITLGAIDFYVTTITPAADHTSGGAAITLTGSGFQSPLVLRIGGVVCPGTAVITAGTTVTGLTVPALVSGSPSANLPIEVTSGSLDPVVLAQTFSYTTTGNVGGGGSGSGGGCVAATTTLWPMGIFATGLLAGRRRRKGQRQ